VTNKGKNENEYGYNKGGDLSSQGHTPSMNQNMEEYMAEGDNKGAEANSMWVKPNFIQ
jgi:hypothetical protein